MNELSDFDFLNLIEKSRKNAQKKIQQGLTFVTPEKLLYDELKSNLFYLNSNHASYHCQIGKLENKTPYYERINYKEHITKSSIAAGMIAIGQPIIRKKVVMKGTVDSTSIASSFLSNIIKTKSSFRIYSINAQFRLVGTKNVGRAIGRLIPNIGVVLLVINAVDILIEIYQANKDNNRNSIFGGGIGGGGGASSLW
ncbi:hypothetical protein [Capnocytophaga felis]|uniref:Uncharacterized protein n=1 Tax=Capnocytophaga felis TaxID=2267611 RepID=A0A5M4BAR6_9FLAO|nr:hypothetical protein [Capnocytophaga felis]GET46684.1 hypothetical protein RCZ01_19860 [Capnocytophaga felis]GET48786.1 hypothetical protein RCZ02_16170 [Capnocytophaga felis]